MSGTTIIAQICMSLKAMLCSSDLENNYNNHTGRNILTFIVGEMLASMFLEKLV